MVNLQATESKIRNLKSKIPATAVSRGVFTINFMRHQLPSAGLRRAGMLATVGALAANLVVLVVLLGVAVSLQRQERIMRAGLNVSGSRAGSADALMAELRPLQGRAAENLHALRRVIAAQRGSLPLAGKLAVLATTLPSRTWIANLSGDRDTRTLTIEAVYVIDPSAPTDLPINSWMSALKADPRFGEGLQKLELSASARASQGRAQLMRFTLAAEWKPSQAGSL